MIHQTKNLQRQKKLCANIPYYQIKARNMEMESEKFFNVLARVN